MAVGYRLTAMPTSFVSCMNSQDTGLTFSCALAALAVNKVSVGFASPQWTAHKVSFTAFPSTETRKH